MRREDEALEEAARLARDEAPSLCRADAAGGTCAWHHGLWPTLRLLGLVTEPALHGEFLRGALAAVAGKAPRVLLSGAADHALLAQVLAAFASRTLRITVLDICETPLLLNRWYAGRAGVAIETCRSDILDYAAPRAFDAICTHAFLGNFDAARARAFAAGSRLAHLWLVPNPPYHPEGDFGIGPDGLGLSDPPKTVPRHTYANLALMRAGLCDHLPAGQRAALGPLLHEAMHRRQISVEMYTGPWENVGTPAQWEALSSPPSTGRMAAQEDAT